MKKNVLLIVLIAMTISFANGVFAQYPNLMLRAQINSSPAGDSDDVIIYFAPAACSCPQNINKLMNTDPTFCNIYVIVTGNNMTYYKFSPLTANEKVQLGFIPNTFGACTFTASELANFVNGTKIYLVDSTSSTSVIKTELTKNPTYSFTFTSTETDNNTRFYLIFEPPPLTASITPESSTTICQGDSVKLDANTGTNYTFQWQLNNVNIVNATTSTYTADSAGAYTVIVTKDSLSVTSQAVAVWVISPPHTAIIPVILKDTVGGHFTFWLSAYGNSPFSYQWSKNGNDIPGATNDTLNLNPISLSDSGVYYCRITNSCGYINPKIATLIVLQLPHSISGYVSYDNPSIQMANTNVYLANTEKTIFDTTTTDYNGYYMFGNLPSGTYNLTCSTTIPWGGTNPVDAYIINKAYMIHNIIPDLLKKDAADVNEDGKINPVDALLIMRRYVGLSNKFKISDWLFSNPTVKVDGMDTIINIMAICAGDVTGADFSIPYLSPTDSVSIVSSNCSTDSLVHLNVYNFNNIGAFGFKIQYDTTVLKYDTIENVNSNFDSITGGIAPYNVSGVLIFDFIAPLIHGISLGNAKLCDLKFTYLQGSTSLSFLTGSFGSVVGDVSCNYVSVKYNNGCVSQATNIAAQPQSTEVCNNTNASFKISTVNSSALTFQWLVSTDSINYNPIADGNDSTLNVAATSSMTGYLYECVVNNACGTCSMISIPATLTVGCGNLSGYVKYENQDSTGMPNTNVYLANTGDKIIDSTSTDGTGYYSFENLIDGRYKVSCTTTEPWGGVTPIDALLVNMTYIRLYKLTDPLKRLAADVNNDKKINPKDALIIIRRYVGLIDRYLIFDWLFSNPTIVIDGIDITKNITAICTGDVNASYVPPLRIENGELRIENDKVITIDLNKPFDIPVYLNDNAELGAIGIKLRIENGELRILNVKSDLEGLIYNIVPQTTDDGPQFTEVNIAWAAENEGYNVTPDKPLFVLRAQYTVSGNLAGFENLRGLNDLIQITSESVLADIDANVISTDKLEIPKLMYDIRSTKYDLQLYNYPNPFNNITNINYTIPEDANVEINLYNVLGEKVAAIVTNERQQAGNHNLKYDGSGLNEGIYFCRLDIYNDNSTYSKTNILIIVR